MFKQMWYERIASALVETDTATEVNAGLFYRYPVKEMCPGPEYLKALVTKGVELTVSSDSHFPDDLGKNTSVNAESLKSLGVERFLGLIIEKEHIIYYKRESFQCENMKWFFER